MIFPEFENGQVIDEVRAKYDPLAIHVRPHVTLVFPFDSNIRTDELKNYMEDVVSELKPFKLVLRGITGVNSFGNYLFLNIEEGKDKIIKLHKRLYAGMLREFYPEWLNNAEFRPHMTVGRIDDEQLFKSAIQETKNISEIFSTIVDKISVEIIDHNEDSVIELNIPLQK
jgi:2'-5' RNA ligase